MTAVRVGFAGVGHWATTAHLPAVAAHPKGLIAAIADPNEVNLRRARETHGIEACFSDPHKMLAEVPLDALILAAPHAHHYAIAKDAVDRGLNVLVEKPLVIDPEDGRKLLAAAEAAGVELLVGYTWHYNRQVLTARQWLHQGRIGDINYVHSFFGSSVLNLYRGKPEDYSEDVYGSGDAFHAPLPSTYSDPSLAGGGQAQTQLTHSMALLLFLTDLRLERVSAFMENHGTEVDVVDALAMRFSGGALGAVGTTGAVTPLEHTNTLEYIVHGTKGHIHFDVMGGSLRLYTDAGLQEEPVLPEEDRYPLAAPANNLIDVSLGSAENGSPAEVGQHTVEAIDAANRSAQNNGAPVDLEDGRV